jgi:hypothetical protein
MWTSTPDFAFGIAAGLGVCLLLKLFHKCHASCQKPPANVNIDADTIQHIMSTLEFHQAFIEQLQHQQENMLNRISLNISIAEPGVS